MVQKEVGERFSAQPGSRDYGSITVLLNYYFDIKKVMDVSRNVFMPVPNVDSIVVEFNKKDELLYVDNKDLFLLHIIIFGVFMLLLVFFKFKQHEQRTSK